MKRVLTKENKNCFIKYLLFNIIALFLFIITKELYLLELNFKVIYSLPSLFGASVFTSLCVPLLIDIKRHKTQVFILVIICSTALLILDEYIPFISQNTYFDNNDLVAIIVGAILTFIVFKSNF
jgi:hypothetical protein